jgi:hypothetical protein
MSTPLTAAEALQREFLEIRARLLAVAASLDRIGRSSGQVEDDPRWQKIQKAIELLRNEDGDRAEQVQLLMSRPYDDHWPQNLGVPNKP